MSRPLRIEFEGAVYHVTSRGNAGQAIFKTDRDRARFLELLGREVEQQRWHCHAYCLMSNHYHLLLDTSEGNLRVGMGRLNAVYSQWFNRRHTRSGHLFQGRYKAILVQRERYLLEMCRYVVLNPVRAGLVREVGAWPWSSYRSTAEGHNGPNWLTTTWVLEQFRGDRARARSAYRRFVSEGIGAFFPWEEVSGQLYLGDATFVDAMLQRIPSDNRDQIVREAFLPKRPTVEQVYGAVAKGTGVAKGKVLDRRYQEAFQATIYLLRRACNVPLKETANLARVSPSRVSQIQRQIEEAGGLLRAFPWARTIPWATN